MANYRCVCGAVNAAGLLRCPRPGCGAVSPLYVKVAPVKAVLPVTVARKAPRRRVA
jgi:hypothetical protein